MGHQIYFNVHREDEPAGTFEVLALFSDNTVQRVVDVPPGGTCNFPKPVAKIGVRVGSGGYWLLTFDAPTHSVTGVLYPLPSGPRGWWHELHKMPGGAPRGAGIKIGIIDEALPLQTHPSIISHVRNLGGAGWNASSQRAYQAFDTTEHGFSICALLAGRPQRSQDYEGIAPDAEVVFAAAGSDENEELDVTRLAESILMLALDERCDIITFSAGDVFAPMRSVQEALIAVQEEGVLCFAAAGNEGAAPGYPARYVECLAVGAVGDLRVAPVGSADASAARMAPPRNVGDVFHWTDSARGPDVDFLGAGVSIFGVDSSGAWDPRSGTSFAAPIVAGTAAVILGKDAKYQQLKGDPARVKYALAQLERLSFNPFADCSRLGIPAA